MNNTIVDATFKNGLELSPENIDAVLGEPVTEILWCKTFYPPNDKFKSDTSIQSFEDLLQERSYETSKYAARSTSYYPTEHRPIRCKIAFDARDGLQVLGTFTKLIGEVLSPERYAQLEPQVKLLKNETNVGIKTCANLLSKLGLGQMQKTKFCSDFDKLAPKDKIIDLSSSGQPFLVCVYNKKMSADICIGILGNMIVKSNLLGGINLNEPNLDYLLGDGDLRIVWCRVFIPNKDKN